MFGTWVGSYAAGTETNASVTKHLTLAQPSISRRSVARTCGDFILRCLKATGQAYAQSAVYYP